MRRVFVSYSRNNLDAVTQLVEDLQAVGIDTWHDQTLTGGQRWWDNILTQIRECDLFIFALSPESWDSEACKSELDYVVLLGKPILPVLVSEGINLNLLSPPLSEIQVTDYRQRGKEAAFALVKSINRTPAPGPLPDPLPKLPQVPVSYLGTLKDRIDSNAPLSPQEQITLIFELEEELREGHSPAEIRDLLLRLKRRDELLAKIAAKVDAALRSLEGKVGGGGGTHQLPPKPGVCPRCRAEVAAKSRFCGSCGAEVAEAGGGETIAVREPDETVPKMPNAKYRRYVCKPSDATRLITDVKAWLSSQGFDSQQVNVEGQDLLLQIKKRGGWRDVVGMATALNILFRPSGDTLAVEIGAGKWADKTVGGVVGWYLLWPLAVTAAFGAWEQMKMPEKIFDYIGTRLVHK